MPEGATQVLGDQLNHLTSNRSSTLGLTFLITLVISLWSANSGMKAMFDALNVVYGEREKRSFINLNALSLAFTLCAIAFLLIALAAMVVLPAVMNYIGLSSVADWLVRVGRWPALLIIVALAIAVLYRYGPSRDEAQWRWISWGSAFAAIIWLIVSFLFSYYTSHFGSYNKTYGSLGAVFGFMTGSGSPSWLSCWARNWTPRWSIRLPATQRVVHQSPWASAAPEWRIRSVLREPDPGHTFHWSGSRSVWTTVETTEILHRRLRAREN
jgi:YihY family inner membrane protein